MNVEQDKLISVKQVALIIGIGPSTVWKWCDSVEGFPKPTKLSARCTRWSLKEVDAFREAAMNTRPTIH
jgi:predicted DNA-binding transcriptional regulator AlpA